MIRPRQLNKRHWWDKWSGFSKKKQILIILILILFIGGALTTFYLTRSKSVVQVTTHRVYVAPKPVTVASPLTGEQVPPAQAARPVTGIMIENSLDARPQSGLQDAGVVFEAVAEGGITRFLALFQDSAPQYIGPVRSLRPYYLDYAAGFQASIVHVGGSPDALAQVTNGSYRNIDEFSYASTFTRISSRNAPHNVYTSFNTVDQLNTSKGYTKSTYTTWPRKADSKLATPSAKTIDISISGPDYYSHYDYNPTGNNYLRSEGGSPHLNLTSAADNKGVQIIPKVVIAVVVPITQGALDASGSYYSDYGDIGSGVAYVFQDGGITTGTWTKNSITDSLIFTDSSGKQIKLNAGQTWISLVSDSSQVSYSP